MSHPRIPASCKDVVVIDTILYLVPKDFVGGNIHLPKEQSILIKDRTIIASVVRCAWLDEALVWANTPVNDCRNFDSISNWKTEAEAIAEQWRKWSKGEPWE